MTVRVAVIASSGHGKNPLQKRVMTIQVAVIARLRRKMLFSNTLKLTSFRNSPFEGGRGMFFNLSLVGGALSLSK